jgi:PAS domain-containing protein
MRQPDSRSTSPSATAAAATSAWLARSDAGLPRQLRFGLYLAFAVVALVTLAQAWSAQSLEQARAADAELLDHAGQQRAQSEELARHALLVADPQRDRARQLQRLQTLHAQSAQDALLFEAAMARQLALQDEADGQLGPALQRWQAARTPLWQHSLDLVALADRAVAPGAEQVPPDLALEAAITAIAGVLQADAATARTAAQALADALRNAAQARGQRQRHVIELWRGGTLLLLLLLAAVAVEPAVRAVRRQLDLLADQADSLQRLAVVAEHTQALVIISDADDRITWTNAAFTQATGWTAAEALGRAESDDEK